MEIRFCQRCTESIPDVDFDAGRAVTVDGKHMHVACALTRSLALNGPRSWLTFVLALYAAAVVTFLLATGLGKEKGEPTAVPKVVEARIQEAVDGAEGRMAEDRRTLVAQAGQEQARLRSEEAVKLREELRGELDKLQERIQEVDRLAGGHVQSLRDRVTRLEEEVGNLSALIREALDKAREAAARAVPVAPPPPPEPVTPPQPVEPSAMPAEPTPPGPAPSNPAHDEEVDRWIRRLKDSNENIRFSATLELGRLKDLRAAAPLIQVLDKDKDYYVRLGAATALGDIKAASAVPALIEALDDSDTLVRTAANDALQAVSGQQFEFVTEMSARERRKVQKQWREWWKANEASVRTQLGQPAE